MCWLKSGVCYFRRKRADFEDSQQSLPHRDLQSLPLQFLGTLRSGSGLSCLFNFSTTLFFLTELCLTFTKQEGVFFYVSVSFVVVHWALFYSAKFHQLAAKWCRK